MSPKRVAEAGDGVKATLDSAVLWVTARAQGPERRKRDPNVRCLHPPKGRRRKDARVCRAEPGLGSPSTDSPGSCSCRRMLFEVLGEEWAEGRSGMGSEGNCRNRVFRIAAWMRMHPPCQHYGHGWHRRALGMEVKREPGEGCVGTSTQEGDSGCGGRAGEIGRLDTQNATQATQKWSGMIGLLVFFNLLQIVLEFHVLFGNAERQRERTVTLFTSHN